MSCAFTQMAALTEIECLYSMLTCKSFLNYSTLKFLNVNFHLKNSLPWDQSTPLGYWAEFFYSAASGAAYLIAFYSMSLLFIGIVLHFGAFNKIYKHWFSQFGASVKNHTDSQLLCKLIKFNIMAKKYVT